MTHYFYPKKADFLPSKKLFLLRAGFKQRDHELNKTMRLLTNDIYIEAIPLVQPIIVYQTTASDRVADIQIPKIFKGIQTITFFISTLGTSIEERIDYYHESGDTTKAMLLDAWASEAIEALNDHFDLSLRKNHQKGTMRFSPGYSEVALTENNKIIRFLECKIVKAHSLSGMLTPQKSTVCMIGWYE